MKVVIFAALVVAAFGVDCVDFTATLPTGYELGLKVGSCAAATGVWTDGVAYTLAELNTAYGKAAERALPQLVCSSGYTLDATNGIKSGACAATAALTGCTKTVVPKAKGDCAAKDFPAVDGKNAAISAPACADGKWTGGGCKDPLKAGAFTVSCTGGADGAAGTWGTVTQASECKAPTWTAASNLVGCPVAKKGQAASKGSAICSSSTVACAGDKPADFDCLGGADADDPTCQADAMNTATGQNAAKICNKTGAKKIGETIVAGAQTCTCTGTNNASAKGLAKVEWKCALTTAAPSTMCAAPSDGGSASSVSAFVAMFAALCAYMW